VRKLNLKKETLAELTSAELTSVVGGDHYLTLPIHLCLSIEVCHESHQITCLVPTYPNSCAC
jgi:hypothetical protein